MTIFVPLSTQPVFLNGKIQVGAIIQIFDAGTQTPRTAYKDGLAQVSWAQAAPGQPLPAGALVTDGNGCVPSFWIVGNPYKVRITSAGGVQIREIDNLPGDVGQGGGGGGGGGGATLKTGDYVWAHTTAIINGRVRANGRTMGNALSGATEFADASTQALFVFLWNADPSLTVFGGRGASALADYNANKQLSLPDLNARTLFGIDGMGTSATGRLASALFAAGNATTLGSVGGEGVHILTLPESAAHTHTGTTQANSAFQMTFTTAAASAGTPAGTIASAGSHNHGGATGFESANHTHDFSGMGAAGSHNHGGSTGFENTSLSLSANLVNSVSRSFGLVNGGNLGSFNYVNDVTFTVTNPNVVPAHFHAMGSDGSHTHGGSTGNQSVDHTHAILTDGSHTHSFTGSAMSAHSHTGSTDAGGVHTHAFTTASAGGGGSHNNMPPFVLATCYIVL